MRLPDDLAAAFNDHISMELSSSMAYLQMSAYLAGQNLTGMASWMRSQSAEESNHAHRFLDFILDRGNVARLQTLEAPITEFAGVEAVFTTTLEQEQRVTRAIHDLYRMATETGDLGSLPFLQVFIAEQNEEEATVERILERVRLAGEESSAILLLDSELGGRMSA